MKKFLLAMILAVSLSVSSFAQKSAEVKPPTPTTVAEFGFSVTFGGTPTITFAPTPKTVADTFGGFGGLPPSQSAALYAYHTPDYPEAGYTEKVYADYYDKVQLPDDVFKAAETWILNFNTLSDPPIEGLQNDSFPAFGLLMDHNGDKTPAILFTVAAGKRVYRLYFGAPRASDQAGEACDTFLKTFHVLPEPTK